MAFLLFSPEQPLDVNFNGEEQEFKMLSIPGHRVVNMSLVVVLEKLGVIATQLILRVSLGEFFFFFEEFGIMLLPIVVIPFLDKGQIIIDQLNRLDYKNY